LKKNFPWCFRDFHSATSSPHSGHGIRGIPLGPRGYIEKTAAGMNDELESSPMEAAGKLVPHQIRQSTRGAQQKS